MSYSRQTLLFISVFLSQGVWASNLEAEQVDVGQEDEQQQEGDAISLDKVYITGGQEQISKKPGSAILLDDLQLEKFEYSDIHRVMNAVPGVNLQEEDGYGLRPNIGLRGTSPERSKKITLMEDGVLAGPAPYSAPAAYYFPNVSRMSAVEVFKGPSTIQYGPATVGGAVNLVSRPVPFATEGQIDVQLGGDGYQRVQAHQGQQTGDFGYVVEALHFAADGFKDLDTGGDTGFERNDVQVKTQWQKMGAVSHLFQFKLGYADEDSNETYLGLTPQDFESEPYRRYAASQLDNTDWVHSQIQLTHVMEASDYTLSSDVYRNEFDRDWFKLNGFNSSSVSIQDTLLDPITYAEYYAVLAGTGDSTTSDMQLRIGNNARQFLSQGVQSRFNKSLFSTGIEHAIEVGVRLHQDEVDLHHTEQNYVMAVGGQLTAVDSTFKTTSRSLTQAQAVAVYVQDEMIMGDSTLTVGVRHENIETEKTSYGVITGIVESVETLNQSVTLPGVGFFRQTNEHLGWLVGVYKGFTAATPSGNENIEPELSTNYEAGFRFSDVSQAEVVAFLNHYEQFSGSCAFSQGCDTNNVGNQANAGSAIVYGIEAAWKRGFDVANVSLPLSVSYTFSHGEFQEDFVDTEGAFGQKGLEIKDGYEIAYLPAHRLNLQVGAEWERYHLDASVLYQSDMRTVPGEGDLIDGYHVPAYTVLDIKGAYDLGSATQVYASVDNLLDNTYLVATKPYGLRPGKPRTLLLGVKHRF